MKKLNDAILMQNFTRSPRLLKAIYAFFCAFWDDLSSSQQKNAASELAHDGYHHTSFTYSRDEAEVYLKREMRAAPYYDWWAEYCRRGR